MPTAWSKRLWGESRAVFFRDNPLHGVKVTLRHPSPPHLSLGSSSAARSSSLTSSKTLQQPQPSRLGLRCAASSHRGTAEEPTRSAHFAASPPHPPGSKTPASPPLEMGDRSAQAVDAKGWQGASGGGEGGCLRKRSLLSPSVCWNKASACIV